MDYTKLQFGGLTINQIPKGISQVPFVWNYGGSLIDMNFYGGYFATKVDEKENSVEPELFWVVERVEKNSSCIIY